MKIAFTTLLFCIFLVLKLCGIITWSWWWVTAPLWLGYALIFLLFIISAFFVGSKWKKY